MKASIKLLLISDDDRDATIARCLASLGRDIIQVAVANGQNAVEMVAKHAPSVVLIDVPLSSAELVSVISGILSILPVPIIVMCSCTGDAVRSTSFEALRAGAVTLARKPSREDCEKGSPVAKLLMESIRTFSQAKLRKLPRTNAAALSPKETRQYGETVIAIGASSGGPPVLQEIFAQVPGNIEAPILVVQHISPGFIDGMREWLQNSTRLKIRIGQDGDTTKPGHVYLAPDNYHMEIDALRRIKLNSSPAEHGVRPSVSHLFRSVERNCHENSIAVLLTGMGKDGARELKDIRSAGAVTIIQDRESSAVYGMPGAALELGAAMYVMDPVRIGQMLAVLVHKLSNRTDNQKSRFDEAANT